MNQIAVPAAAEAHEPALENLAHERRHFKPSASFAASANVTAAAYVEAEQDRTAFWEDKARRLTWSTPWTQTLDWSDPPFARWFVGGELNVAYNCLDRHLEGENAWRRNKAAIIWEGEPGDSRTITYADLNIPLNTLKLGLSDEDSPERRDEDKKESE